MLTNDCLESEGPNHIGGVQRNYKFPSGWGLSLINSSVAHYYSYAWEAAVLQPNGALNYNTPLTSDVAVFATEEEVNNFIAEAKAYFSGQSPEELKALEGPRQE